MPDWLFRSGLALGSVLLNVFGFALMGVCAVPIVWALLALHAQAGWVPVVIAAPVAYLAWGLTFAGVVVALKWGTFSRFREGRYPFASLVVARWAFINVLVVLCNQWFMRWWHGSIVLVLWFRALGARIGRNVVLNTTVIGDWDLLTIDDDAFIAADAAVLCHLGEQGHVRFAPVRIGAGCTVGFGSRVFPGVVMEPGATLGASSLVKKHSHLGAGEVWGGVPARLVKSRSPEC